MLELANAKVIVSLDADLFGGGSPLAIKYARDFAAGRRLHDKKTQKEMNRLYVIESLHTITGASADHRLACGAGEIAAIARELAAALGVAGVEAPKDSKLPLLNTIKPIWKTTWAMRSSSPDRGSRPKSMPWSRRSTTSWAMSAKRWSTIPIRSPSGHRTRRPWRPWSSGWRPARSATLLILGGNPVYKPRQDLKFAEALKKVPNSIHLALHEDETSQLCTWHLSRAHYLESWGDARTFDGTVSIVQPLIEPLFEGRSPIEVLSMIVDEKPRTGYDIVRETVKSLVGKSLTEYRWKKLLAEGVIKGTEWKPAKIEKLAMSARSRDRRIADPARPDSAGTWPRANTTGLLHRQSCTMAASPTTAGCRNCPIR